MGNTISVTNCFQERSNLDDTLKF
ncbi:unnamed protein product [Acanthoscelides obtectus]|uniref:Uncharacterized protein n=1 Tax=Acanthoscelides obtectus TaxID=200917 RepID=A0A9P0QH76_ACAOB|nr:unnamed protein product [Acanthoscelides obtectus]CAK1683055.1 hypothetical protein AOBTE_LOCUS34051 [Acanthoscelides obtectus]